MNMMERTLASFWQKVLNVFNISRHDNFFEIGGHSLKAVELVGQMRQAGFDMSIAVLFANPTIERMAAYLEGEDNPILKAGAIPLRTTGSKKPLFLIHEVSGEVLYGPALTNHIDIDIPVYGLAGVHFSENPLKTFHAQASRLVNIIKAVQPNGPYRLAGWSLGGTLAYEIAVQLIGADEKVEFLGLLDAYNVFASATATTTQVKMRTKKYENRMLLSMVLERFGNIDPSQEKQLVEDATTMEFLPLVEKWQKLQLLPNRLNGEYIQQILYHWRIRYSAGLNYNPPAIPITVHLFRTDEGLNDRNKAANDLDVRLRYWGRILTKEQIRIVPVTGTHHSIVSEPQHVENLGKLMSEEIRKYENMPRK
jgi:thioesterase domain-containing protein/aryl carrier-like protein